ncbi:EamA family transporter [Bacillus sp. B4EP4a]|uniref:DMT family transporter n=1 Tax=Bacillus sp. B4EP4a TaxID=2590665 RepID=UPI00114F7EDE|nr:EamA family transporter [Bacillus sp. B4EP4a]
MIIFNYICMCLIFGTTFLAIKIGVDEGLPPFFSAGIRFFMAGILLFLMMSLRKKANLAVLFSKESFITGSTLTFGTFATLYWAEQYVASGVGAVLSATGPIMILLIQTMVLHVKLSIRTFVGCAISLIGVALLLMPNLTVSFDSIWLIACFLILLGQVGYAAGTIYSKKVSERFSGTSPIMLNAAQMIYGGALLLLLSLASEQINIGDLANKNAIGSIVYLTVFGSMIAHTVYYWLVSKTDPIFPSTWLYISPIIALGLGKVLYQEKITWLMFFGGITIIAGLIVINSKALITHFANKCRTDSVKSESYRANKT